jgi:hypothetical protein
MRVYLQTPTPHVSCSPCNQRAPCVMRMKRGGEGGAHHRALPAGQSRDSFVDRGRPWPTLPRPRPTLPRPR